MLPSRFCHSTSKEIQTPITWRILSRTPLQCGGGGDKNNWHELVIINHHETNVNDKEYIDSDKCFWLVFFLRLSWHNVFSNFRKNMFRKNTCYKNMFIQIFQIHRISLKHRYKQALNISMHLQLFFFKSSIVKTKSVLMSTVFKLDHYRKSIPYFKYMKKIFLNIDERWR